MNFTLTYENSTTTHDYSKAMEHTNNLYTSTLEQRTDTREYLYSRGISDASIKEFEIGFAASSQEQTQNFQAHQFNMLEFVECGVCAKDESGSLYARLTNRITFAIRSHNAKLIGFGGRIVDGDRAKYLNSPQTKLFDKSRNLYGYNIAKKHIYDKGTFTIVEGYLDVVMFHQAGIKTAVATMGTALTEQHIKLIKKVEGARVLVCFDGDKAGVQAAFKAAKLLSSHGVFGGVVLFPEGKDPADMVKDGKIEELHALMKSKSSLIKFVIAHIAASYDIIHPHQKQEALAEINAYMQTLSPLMQDEHKAYIAKKLNISQEHIQSQPVQKQSAPQTRLSYINIQEMNIIATANESETNFDIALDVLDGREFLYHAAEFAMLTKERETLAGLCLRDEISVYTPDELLKQCKILSVAYHRRKIDEILLSSKSFEEKSFEVRRENGIILTLKKEIGR
jgi:DNA primase